ncbi:MAG: DUF2341 domain-containing protein [bacterium]|nr:DUF2341 domain-containing protein [bacterium]
MQSDCDDIRVTDSDGTTLLYHWIEQGSAACNTSTTKIWAKTPSISTSGTTVYIYYGNSSASNTEDGSNVFLLWDDFSGSSLNTSKWTDIERGTSGSVTITGGEALLAPTFTTTSASAIQTVGTYTNGIAMVVRRKYAGGNSYQHMSFGAGAVSDSDSCGTCWWEITLLSGYKMLYNANGNSANGIYRIPSSSGRTSLSSGASTLFSTSYSVHQMYYDSNGTFKWIADGTTYYLSTDTTFLSTNKTFLIAQGQHTSSSAGPAYLDWAFVRKVTSTEPSAASASSEEQVSSGASSSSSSSSSPADPNSRPGWSKTIMVGPNRIGSATFIGNSNILLFVSNDASKDDLHVSFNKPSLQELSLQGVSFPWSQGLNVASDIYEVSAVSAFNGFPILTTDKPFIIQMSYDPIKVLDLSTNSLKIAYFDSSKNKWQLVNNPYTVDTLKHTIATTSTHFGFYAVVYPSSAWGFPTSDLSDDTEPSAVIETPNDVVDESASDIETKTPESSTTEKPRKDSCFLNVCWYFR